jgi:hypothetical protein
MSTIDKIYHGRLYCPRARGTPCTVSTVDDEHHTIHSADKAHILDLEIFNREHLRRQHFVYIEIVPRLKRIRAKLPKGTSRGRRVVSCRVVRNHHRSLAPFPYTCRNFPPSATSLSSVTLISRLRPGSADLFTVEGGGGAVAAWIVMCSCITFSFCSEADSAGKAGSVCCIEET